MLGSKWETMTNEPDGIAADLLLYQPIFLKNVILKNMDMTF